MAQNARSQGVLVSVPNHCSESPHRFVFSSFSAMCRANNFLKCKGEKVSRRWESLVKKSFYTFSLSSGVVMWCMSRCLQRNWCSSKWGVFHEPQLSKWLLEFTFSPGNFSFKGLFFPPSVAGVSHSSEVRRRTGGETKAKGSNHVLSLGELEQRRRPGIRGNWLGHWVTRGHPVAILQGKNKDLSSLH